MSEHPCWDLALIPYQSWVRNYPGAEFVVPFFSRSRSFALKLSLKSHLMTTFFVQNDDFLAQIIF